MRDPRKQDDEIDFGSAAHVALVLEGEIVSYDLDYFVVGEEESRAPHTYEEPRADPVRIRLCLCGEWHPVYRLEDVE